MMDPRFSMAKIGQVHGQSLSVLRALKDLPFNGVYELSRPLPGPLAVALNASGSARRISRRRAPALADPFRHEKKVWGFSRTCKEPTGFI